jgi:hypothetical protein
LRNWLARGELLIVFVFNFGGVPGPLMKRETKEPSSSSSNICEMKYNSEREDMVARWEREELGK